MNEYQLKPNKFSPYCEGKYDIRNNIFRETSYVDEVKCCRNKCIDDIKYCRDNCKLWGKEDCNYHCNQIQKLCDFGCLRIESETKENIQSCLEEKGCSIYSNKECMDKNREYIIDCCNKKCVNDCSSNICEETLNFFRDEIKTFETPLKYGNENKDKSHIYLLFFVGLIVLIIGVVFLARK